MGNRKSVKGGSFTKEIKEERKQFSLLVKNLLIGTAALAGLLAASAQAQPAPSRVLPGLFDASRPDDLGLKAARFGAFHLLPNAMDFSHVHRVVREGALLY